MEPHLLSSIELLYLKIGMGVCLIKKYKVIVSGSILLERSLVMIIIMANVIIVRTIHNRPLSICKEAKFPFATTK